MKTPIKKLTKIRILFFGISLMLTLANCQKEEISDINETTAANNGMETARTQNRMEDGFVVYIDTTSIKAITNGEMGTFTMPVVTRDHSKYFFTDLVLSKKERENDWRYTFVRYWPTPYWSNLNDQSDEAPPFDGKIEIMDEHGDVKMSAQFENGISIDPKADFGIDYAPFTYNSGGGCSCSSGGGLSFLAEAWGAISEAVSTGLNWLGDFFSDLGNGGGGNGNGGPSFYGGYYGYQTSGYDYSTPYIPSGGGGSGSPSIPYTITNPDTGEGLINQWLPDITPEQLNLLIANTTPDGTSLFAMAVGYLSQGGGSAGSIASRVLNSECLSLNDKTQILYYLNENNVPVPDDPTGGLNFSEQETFVQEAITAICEGDVESFEEAEYSFNLLNQLLEEANSSTITAEIENFIQQQNNSYESIVSSIGYLESILDTTENEFDDYEIPPDCESFNFQNTTQDAYWQNAAVKNIRFKVVVLSPQGNYINFNVHYPQPILFGMPTNMVNGGDISSGLAAELSAQALKTSMDEVVAMYGNQPASELQVRLYFEQRLKHNYPIMTNGGRVNFNPMALPVTPTEYQTTLFGTGNCD